MKDKYFYSLNNGVDDSIIKFIKLLFNGKKYNRCFMTGSRLFGVSHSKSDYDFVVLDSFFQSYFKKYYDGMGYHQSQYIDEIEFKSLTYLFEKKHINLILAKDIEFEIWKYATNNFKMLCDKDDKFRDMVKDKVIRCNIFQELKESYRKYLNK